MANRIKKMKEFNVGDGIIVQGWSGTVTGIERFTHVCGSERFPCTSIRVAFDEPEKIGYQYNNEWYGGHDEVAVYGYFER